MTEEIGRRLINDVWVTNVEAQSGGGGGGITRVTSDDETVTITNPTGPTVDLSASGGSQPLKTATVLVTSAEILALDSVPVTIVAGVPGSMLIPLLVSYSTDGGTPYTNGGSNRLLVGGRSVGGLGNFGTIISDPASSPTGWDPMGSGDASTVFVDGDIQLGAGDPNTDGDFDVTVTVLYQEVVVP